MGKLILVLGMSGVGKSAVIENALKEAKEKYDQITFGDFILEQGIKLGIGKDRDEVRRSASTVIYKEMQMQAAKAIADLINKKNKSIILNSHAIVWLKGGYYPGFPAAILEKLKPDAIILITAKPEDIVKRREKDAGTRARDEISLQSITEMQEVSKWACISYGILVGAPVKIIENPEGKIEQAADAFLTVIKSL